MHTIKRLTVLLAGMLLANGAFATYPMLDLIEHNGKYYPLAFYTNPPSNPKLLEWERNLPWCSAFGQGRPVYKVEANQIFIIKFRGCGTELSVSEAYDSADPKLLATWLDGKYDVALGSCNGGWDPAKESFFVKQGELVKFVTTP